MFVRFRQNARRLNVSLVETRRADGKIKHEHIASLGPIKPRCQSLTGSSFGNDCMDG